MVDRLTPAEALARFRENAERIERVMNFITTFADAVNSYQIELNDLIKDQERLIERYFTETALHVDTD